MCEIKFFTGIGNPDYYSKDLKDKSIPGMLIYSTEVEEFDLDEDEGTYVFDILCNLGFKTVYTTHNPRTKRDIQFMTRGC